MSAIKTLSDADKYGLCIAVRCPGCAKDVWLKPGKLPGDRNRNPWKLTFKCSDCGEMAGVRDVVAGASVQEDMRRIKKAAEAERPAA